MKIKPFKIPILTEEYTVKVTPKLMENEKAEGLVRPHEHLIEIDEELIKNERVFLRVLWHEIGHAYSLESGLHEFITSQAAEQFCQTFSALIIQLTGGKIIVKRKNTKRR